MYTVNDPDVTPVSFHRLLAKKQDRFRHEAAVIKQLAAITVRNVVPV